MTDFPKRWEGGRGYKKYCYTVKVLSELSGLTPSAVRIWFKRKNLDIGDLEDVCRFLRYAEGKKEVES